MLRINVNLRIKKQGLRAACVVALGIMAASPFAMAQQIENWQTFPLEEFQQAPDLPPREVLAGISVDPALRALTQTLDDSSFANREKATQEIVERNFDRSQIYAVLEFEQLSAEQRYRLLAVVRESLVAMPRGALGIQMQQVQFGRGPVEVRVQDLLPGLPAERVLRVGDAITAFNGEALRTHNELQYRIQMKKPGDKVRLSVKRIRVDAEGQPLFDANNQPQYEMLEIDVELGSAELLGNQGNGGFGDMSAVQRARLREATEVVGAYAPKARDISLKGYVGTPNRPMVQDTQPIDFGADRTVDSHPLIQKLIVQRTMVKQGQRELTPALRQQWFDDLQELIDGEQAPDLTPEERWHLKRVIQRYNELLLQN